MKKDVSTFVSDILSRYPKREVELVITPNTRILLIRGRCDHEHSSTTYALAEPFVMTVVGLPPDTIAGKSSET